ncbi:hypothetical protein LCGC14_1389840 [marine sediment metagenome]|uniref:Uncharacterized protein n=1 Tax=marine sediment metagenome TaxID=412755 RepID=A0A0F9MFW5_9ZZZZ
MKALKEVIAVTLLVVLPLDILYLYYAGGWVEPIKVILYVDLVMLYCIPIYGIWQFISWIRRER